MMEDFFYDSYKGFYCSLCNFKNHKFFDEQNAVITYSEKFCRDIVEHTLSTLLFFHVHLNKYSNLVSKFVLSCDKKGDYEADVRIPVDYVFVSDEMIQHSLEECRTEKDTHNWFVYCKSVCENFNINSFSEYFEPK